MGKSTVHRNAILKPIEQDNIATDNVPILSCSFKRIIHRFIVKREIMATKLFNPRYDLKTKKHITNKHATCSSCGHEATKAIYTIDGRDDYSAFRHWQAEICCDDRENCNFQTHYTIANFRRVF